VVGLPGKLQSNAFKTSAVANVRKGM
jgi:hypothetical protein